MSINTRLAHVGNKVVKIRQKISKIQQDPSFMVKNDNVQTLSLISEVLEIINLVRMEVAYESIEKEYEIKLTCSNRQLQEILENIEEVGVDGESLMIGEKG